MTHARRAQVERNLHDAMGVARNVMLDPRLVPGGGACEMAVSRGLSDRADAVVGPEQARRTVHRQKAVAFCLRSWSSRGCCRVLQGVWRGRWCIVVGGFVVGNGRPVQPQRPRCRRPLAQSRQTKPDLEPHHMDAVDYICSSSQSDRAHRLKCCAFVAETELHL